MLMPKRHRALIYEYLFKEGVLVAMKDTHLAKHPEIEVPNLHVMKALQVGFSYLNYTIQTSLMNFIS